MSAPKTDLDKQKRRHIGPLLGMALVVVFGVVLIIYWQFEESVQGLSPGQEVPAVPGTAREVVPQAPEGTASGN